MAIIAGVTVDFTTSPRMITIPSPITSVTVQDLHDTIRDIEDEPSSMQYTHLVSSAGKENLGGGVFVGITMTLQNARIAFEARPGPSYVQCIISGGNTVAVDDVGAPIDPIDTTAFTQVVIAQSSSATLTPNTALTLPEFIALK